MKRDPISKLCFLCVELEPAAYTVGLHRLLDVVVFLRRAVRGEERMWNLESYRMETSQDARQKIEELKRILRKAGRIE